MEPNIVLLKGTLEAFDCALVRLWTIGPGDLCTSCPMRAECPDQTRCLHLVESAGATTRTDGPYRRFPIGAREVGRTAIELGPFVARERLAATGVADPAWLEVHRVRSFVAIPLLRGKICEGVLALFSRRVLSDAEVALLLLAASRPVEPVPPPTATASPAPSRSARAARPDPESEARTLAEIERAAIARVLEQSGGRVSGPRGAAKILGLHPSTLNSRMLKLGLRRRPRDRAAARAQ